MEHSPSPSLSTLSDAPSDATIHYLRSISPRLDSYVQTDGKDDTVFLIETTYKHLPSDGQHNLANDIDDCSSDEELRQLVTNIDTALLRPVKALGGKTAPVTPSPRAGVEDSMEGLRGAVDDPIKREQRRLRDEGLKRQANECAFTNIYEESAHPHPPGRMLGALEAAHILPFFSLGTFETEEERDRICIIWNTVYRYFPAVRSRLNFGYENLNDVCNVMMLLGPLHAHFGSFKLALEPTAVDNQYKIRKFFNQTSSSYPWFYNYFPDGDLVTLTSHDPRYPVPHRVLLETHFLIASILHATGRGEIVELNQRKYGETGTLASDGSMDIAGLLSVTTLGPSNEVAVLS